MRANEYNILVDVSAGITVNLKSSLLLTALRLYPDV